MCGIGGWYCWGEARPTVGIIGALLLANQTRGTDAAGVAYYMDDKIHIDKQKGPASELLRNRPPEHWARIAQSPRGLIHARARTQGSENNNENNHPVSSRGWVVVHNGHIGNDDALFKKLGYARFAEVDTAAIPLVLGEGNNFLDSLTRLSWLSGSISTAVWSADSMEQIALARLGHNDIYLFMDQDNRILYWSSAAIVGRRMPHVQLGSMRFLTMSKMEDDRVLVLQPNAPFGRIFKITRRPFMAFRGTGHRPISDFTKDTTQTTTTPTKTTAFEKGCKAFKFIGSNTLEGKPGPILERKTLVFDTCKYDNIVEKVKKTSDKTKHVLTSAYGRWEFVSKNNTVFRIFRPTKRVRRFLNKHFGKILLPQALLEGKTPLDKKLYLEPIVITESMGANSEYKADGYICPWCGVWVERFRWRQTDNRCSFCNVSSEIKSVETGV